MIGAANLIKAQIDGGSQPPAPGELKSSITPDNINIVSANGSWTSPRLVCTASGGVSPYSYEWSSTNGTVTPSDSSCRVRLSGYNSIANAVVKCIITDNNGDSVESTATISVNFEGIIL